MGLLFLLVGGGDHLCLVALLLGLDLKWVDIIVSPCLDNSCTLLLLGLHIHHKELNFCEQHPADIPLTFLCFSNGHLIDFSFFFKSEMFHVITSDAAINWAGWTGVKEVFIDGYFHLLFVQKKDLDLLSILMEHWKDVSFLNCALGWMIYILIKN